MDLSRIYSYRFRDIDQAARSEVWGAIARYLHRRLGEPRRLLDPAAGLGEFIANSPAQDRWAVDMVDHGLTSIKGLTTRIAPILEADLPEGTFDAVFASNLLEHLSSPTEIAQFLSRMRGLLRPGGVIFALFNATETLPTTKTYTRFVVVDDTNIQHRPYSAARSKQKPLPNRDIQRMFEPLRVIDQFLLKTNTREMLFRK